MLTADISIHGYTILCAVPPDVSLSIGQTCIVETDNVREWGVVRELAEISEQSLLEGERHVGKVIRPATEEDTASLEETAAFEAEAFRLFVEHVDSLQLPMRPLCVRSSFGRERLLLMFSAESQVDVGRLAYHLRRDLGTRIELRQVGVRDEAGILGGMGPCGRKLCCNTWLHRFRAVNVRMARAQGVSLNPGAIGGICGRLKCCLRFEYDQYREASRSLPSPGTKVQWAGGDGIVIGRDLLSGRLTVRTPERGVVHVNVSEICSCGLLDGADPAEAEDEDLCKDDGDNGDPNNVVHTSGERSEPGHAGQT